MEIINFIWGAMPYILFVIGIVGMYAGVRAIKKTTSSNKKKSVPEEKTMQRAKYKKSMAGICYEIQKKRKKAASTIKNLAEHSPFGRFSRRG